MINPKLIFSITNPTSFSNLALDIFRYQAKYNPVYKEWLELRKISPANIIHVNQIPFLPIEFFKTHKIITGPKEPDIVFLSSGTTGSNVSRHYISDISIYEQSFFNTFHKFYGDPQDYCILALLPSYLEREGSSLLYMINKLIQASRYRESGFFLNEYDEILRRAESLQIRNIKVLLFGVSFALLDLAEQRNVNLSRCIIMETGGMKGRKEEITREELHRKLSLSFHSGVIHSEYGMTEMLSQAYSKGNGRFFSPPWLKIVIRDLYDPFRILPANKHGAINIIDLANIHSVSFIETKDLGMLHNDESFEVLGRYDNSDVRGCSLLVT